MIRFPTKIDNDTITVELPAVSTTIRHARALIAVVESLLLRGFARIVLDLRRTTRLGSAQVQAVVFLHAATQSHACVLLLDNVSSQVRRDLQRVDPGLLPTIWSRPEQPEAKPRPRRWERARTVRYPRGIPLQSRASSS